MSAIDTGEAVRTPAAARELGIPLEQVYELIRAGTLAYCEPEYGRLCVTRTSLDAFAETARTTAHDASVKVSGETHQQ